MDSLLMIKIAATMAFAAASAIHWRLYIIAVYESRAGEEWHLVLAAIIWTCAAIISYMHCRLLAKRTG